MHRYLRFLSMLIIIGSNVYSQTPFLSTREISNLTPVPAGLTRSGFYGFENPALLSVISFPDLGFIRSFTPGESSDLNRWGIFLAAPHVSIGAIHSSGTPGQVTDYRISFSGGDDAFSIGAGYGWSAGNSDVLHRSSVIQAGLMSRPADWLSLGITGISALERSGQEISADCGVRPFRSDRFTAFVQYALASTESPSSSYWSYGAAVHPLDGIRLVGRYAASHAVSLGVEISFGRASISDMVVGSSPGSPSSMVYGVRIGEMEPSAIHRALTGSRFVSMNLNGPLEYQRYRFFDNSNTLLDILRNLDQIRQDGSIKGIAVNLSGSSIDREMEWELREKLLECRASGKIIIIFIDRGGMSDYDLASTADLIVMDPLGTLTLQGYVSGGTYFKGTLEKLGIGFDEWRFFKYKSAMESYSRTSMSDGDRIQRRKLIDDQYELIRSHVCSSRHFSSERFDSLINDTAVFEAYQARESGLVDTLGRWDEIPALMNRLCSGTPGEVSVSGFQSSRPVKTAWGSLPKIAVIYALGTCAMDMGLNARALLGNVERVVRDSSVKAIVMRVDSPGGDGLASDIIAEALRKCKGVKPVIISQGYVAASGGYWLSMYADTIVAAPNTLTGSIGVIGGWLYNDGLKEKLGITTDFVKRGDHADLLFGMAIPLIGINLPDRNLSADEHTKMAKDFHYIYTDFVSRVARGRKLAASYVDSIGQGRVWSGTDGLHLGLVDVVGGLDRAISIAKQKAGIAEGQDVAFVEIPEPGWFDFGVFMPKVLGSGQLREPAILQMVKFMSEHNGQAIPLMPMESLDEIPNRTHF